MLELSNVDISYGSDVAVRDVSFSVDKGELVSIIGPNGSGKSTLLRAILGIKKNDKGTILIKNLSPQKAISQLNMSYLPQQYQINMLLPLTVYEVVAQKIKKIRGLNSSEKNDIETALKKVNMFDKKDELFMNLSGGQRQRVLLGLALVNKPEILFLDEPTNTLDVASIDQIYAILSALKKEGMTILLISHDISSIVSHSDKIGVMMKELQYFGTPEQLPESTIHHVFGSHIKIIPNDPDCTECAVH